MRQIQPDKKQIARFGLVEYPAWRERRVPDMNGGAGLARLARIAPFLRANSEAQKCLHRTV